MVFWVLGGIARFVWRCVELNTPTGKARSAFALAYAKASPEEQVLMQQQLKAAAALVQLEMVGSAAAEMREGTFSSSRPLSERDLELQVHETWKRLNAAGWTPFHSHEVPT